MIKQTEKPARKKLPLSEGWMNLRASHDQHTPKPTDSPILTHSARDFTAPNQPNGIKIKVITHNHPPRSRKELN